MKKKVTKKVAKKSKKPEGEWAIATSFPLTVELVSSTRNVSKVSEDLGREDLNALARKVNELVDIVNSL